MLLINFVGREAKGLSKGRYDETFAGEDVTDKESVEINIISLYNNSLGRFAMASIENVLNDF